MDVVLLQKIKRKKMQIDNVRKNSIYAMVLRFIVLTLGFVVVKLAYNYLDQTRYGVWMTILAIFQWVAVVDLGISNGLRNRLTECLAKNDIKMAKTYVSTAYAVFGMFILLLMAATYFLLRIVNYEALFNVNTQIASEIRTMILFITPLFLFTFYLSIINAVLYAKQDSALYDFRFFIFNIVYIIAIVVIKVFTHNSLMMLSASYIFGTIASYIILTLYLFSKRYQDISPGLSFIRIGYIKNILNIGVLFLVVQITNVVLMSADNILITQLLGPEHVSVYQIVNKPFIVVYILFTGITAPLWSAFTDHYTRNDLAWITGTIKKMLKLLIPIAGMLIIVALSLKLLIYLWIGKELDYSLLHIVLICLYVIQLSWNVIFVSFCNGVGKLKSQLLFTVISAVMNIPLSVVFVKVFSFGLSGILLSLIISNLLLSAALPVITLKTLRDKKNELKGL